MTIQMFRRAQAAYAAAAGSPLFAIQGGADTVYLTGFDAQDDALEGIELHAQVTRDRWTPETDRREPVTGYEVTGHVTRRHLGRLGNANWAQPGMQPGISRAKLQADLEAGDRAAAAYAERLGATAAAQAGTREELQAALGVLFLSAETRAWLTENDPMALRQVMQALGIETA